MSAVDELMKEFAEEDGTSVATVETVEPVETPSEEPERVEEPVKEEPTVDDKPEESPKDVEDDTPSEDAPKAKKEHEPIPDDPVKRAEFSFRRQLAKKDERHAKELAERDEKYAKLEKEMAELREQIKPKEAPMTRDKFPDDEDYLKYLAKQQYEEERAKDKAAEAKAAEERAAAEKKAREEQEELARSQQEWLEHVDKSFEGDKERADKFIKRVQYCNSKGLGEILDKCPVAADYLMHNPSGPVVFEKILNDKDTMMRVFNEERLSPLDIYYELREVEKEIRNSAPAAAPTRVMPHLGRPGKQAGTAAAAPDIWNDDDALHAWMKAH